MMSAMLPDPVLLGRILLIVLAVALADRELRRARDLPPRWGIATLAMLVAFVGLSVGHIATVAASLASPT
jgi:hypothetical protein